MTESTSQSIPSKPMPNFTLGYVLSGITFLLAIVLPPFMAFFAWVAGFTYYCICLYRVHVTLQEVSSSKYPVTPGKAVGFQFIPFFNWYWLFRWTGEMAKMINGASGTERITPWVPGLFLFMATLLSIILSSAFSLLASFLVLAYLVKHLSTVLESQAMPIADYEQKCPIKSGSGTEIAAIICCAIAGGIVILGIMAAVAIPNFLAARDATLGQEKQPQTQSSSPMVR